MGSIEEIMQVCRLCLSKEQVNVQIFEENLELGQRVQKINSCLPVKVSLADNLPKKICDGCSYKVDMLYVFRSTSANSEKQLIKLLADAGLAASQLPQPTAKDNNIAKSEVSVKQEQFEATDINAELGSDANSYILQQQKLPYQQDFNFVQPSGSTATTAKEETPPTRKRVRRAAAAASAKKTKQIETDEDDDDEDDSDDDDDDDMDNTMEITKAEDDDSEEDTPDYVEAPSTSADDQPGPSGVGTATTEPGSMYQQSLYSSSTYNEITSLQCYTEIPVDNISSVVDHLNETDTDLLNLLTTEADCTDILNNLSENDHFERLISSDSNFVTDLIDEIKNDEASVKILNSFKCYQCSKVFKSKKLLKKHLFIHTGVRNFSCEICGKDFRYKYEVNVHKRSHNNPTFQCDICSKMFLHKSHLTTHRRKHLNDFVAFCKECNIGFVSQSLYKSHVDLMHKNLYLICDVCGYKLSSLSSLKEHKLTHDPDYGKERSHVCDVCGKSYLNLRNLKSHMKIHQQIKSHVCGICGKSVSSKKILETHIKMHTGLKDFICKICNKPFASKEYLDVHTRIHTGTKPFSCTICGKRFTQKTSLTVHIRHHTGQRPYKCECGKEFTTKSHLMTHYKAHDVGGVDIDYISRPVS